MNENKIRALFCLAEIPILELTQAPNPYWNGRAGCEEYAAKTPQWKVKIAHGDILVHEHYGGYTQVDWSGIGNLSFHSYPYSDRRMMGISEETLHSTLRLLIALERELRVIKPEQEVIL